MSPVKLQPAESVTIAALIPDWERSLQAANKSPRTIRSYGDSARLFEEFARERLGVTAVDRITRETVETFVNDQLEHWKATTAAVRYRSLQQFFKWLLEEREIAADPMRNMKPPKVGEVVVPVVSDDDMRKLLATCEGRGAASFEDRRDAAILRVFFDTGIRLSECAGLRVEDADTRERLLIVTGKGDRQRYVPFGSKTATALDRYLRMRPRHPQAASSALFLGFKGAMTPSGIAQMLERRCDKAEIARVHPHQFRHTAAHVWFLSGGTEVAAMRNFGWRSRTMLSRYGASAADERARDEAHRLALGDRL